MRQPGLTRAERELLERHCDAELLPGELEPAERLLAQSSMARLYLASLGELRIAVRGAEELWWMRDGASAALSTRVLSQLDGVTHLTMASLTELEPLLDRHHDAELSRWEEDEVAALLVERADAAAYVSGLEALRAGADGAHGALAEGVSFEGMWQELSARLDAEDAQRRATPESSSGGGGKVLSFPVSGAPGATRERPAFKGEDHQVLLYRYHDGEASAAERAQVGAWSELDAGVSSTLSALSELNLAVHVAVEHAQERVELSQIWAGLEGRLDASSGSGEQVVSLSARRAASAPAAGRASHRRELMIAMAAVLCTVLGVALFQESIFGPQRVIVEKTVVIVDSVEYGEGTSVMVTGPLQAASYEPSALSWSSAGTQAKSDALAGEDGEEMRTPTVIWLIDPEQEPVGEEAPGAAPVESAPGRAGRPI